MGFQRYKCRERQYLFLFFNVKQSVTENVPAWPFFPSMELWQKISYDSNASVVAKVIYQ